MNPAPRDRFDVAVIGGGVVGCAVLRALTLAGLRAVLLEKSGDILEGASKGNSAILHTGFDAKPGTLEARLVRRGYELYRTLGGELGLPFLELGATVLAWSEAECDKLPAIADQALSNGVDGVRLIGVDKLRQSVAGLGPGVLGAVDVPGEGIIDPWSAPLAYVLQAMANGAIVHRGAPVTRAERTADGGWHLGAGAVEVEAGVVVNCAGLQGDLVEALVRRPSFRIRPRKGQYIVLDKTARRHVGRILLPVPNDRTKGVVVTPTIYGNVLIGPTAEDQESRDDASVDRETLRQLEAAAARLVPALADEPINATYAGIRPATEQSDYRIEALTDQRWITVGGIRSTGLTGSLGIAEYVVELYRAQFGDPCPIAEPRLVRVPNLAEHRPRPYQNGTGTEIVCHCEWVTRSEIEQALGGRLPAGTLGGLKRRTRCMMGRCQGFYCSAQIFALARHRFPVPEAQGRR